MKHGTAWINSLREVRGERTREKEKEKEKGVRRKKRKEIKERNKRKNKNSLLLHGIERTCHPTVIDWRKMTISRKTACYQLESVLAPFLNWDGLNDDMSRLND